MRRSSSTPDGGFRPFVASIGILFPGGPAFRAARGIPESVPSGCNLVAHISNFPYSPPSSIRRNIQRKPKSAIRAKDSRSYINNIALTKDLWIWKKTKTSNHLACPIQERFDIHSQVSIKRFPTATSLPGSTPRNKVFGIATRGGTFLASRWKTLSPRSR